MWLGWIKNLGPLALESVRPQAFDVPGVSEYTVASNMARNRIFYIRYFVSQYSKYGF